MELIIDATNQIMGRLCTHAAKAALLGTTVNIINCERAVITGSRTYRQTEMRTKKELGQPQQGPFASKMPDRFVRRCVRGMLPHHQPKGRAAFERVMCYIGTPLELQGKETTRYDDADVAHATRAKHLTIAQVCEFWGYKGASQ
ncbi:50S ribosomal protein L13 [Candidatus Woesearchaeota archaeon]|nr:50S ribosomal protein L13 [Candidatus Woesearchaeota archaeon]